MNTIVLDPGHGGNGALTTYGSVGNGLVEKEVNLLLARYCRTKLSEYECRVVMTRDSDIDISFTARANVARHNNADLFVSFHLNGFHDVTANGFESFIYSGTLSQNTINYQHAIHNKIYSVLERAGVRDRGKKRANLAMVRLPPCSCVLPEYGFITNVNDAKAIKSPGMIKLLGEYTALGIAEALKLPLLNPAGKPDYGIPEVQRTVGVMLNGQQTNEVGYLIGNATYVRAAFVMGLTGATVTGAGDHIKIKT